MLCPRCGSSRIQRGYKEVSVILKLAGRQELLCNNCGLEFRGLDLLGRLKREPLAERKLFLNRRAAPRFKVHLPATISLVDLDPGTGKTRQSQPSRGHCETLSTIGLALSFVGARLAEEALARTGRLLFVSIVLPKGPITAVITTVTHQRIVGETGNASWFVGASITQISDPDKELLAAYLERRAELEPLGLSE